MRRIVTVTASVGQQFLNNFWSVWSMIQILHMLPLTQAVKERNSLHQSAQGSALRLEQV